MGEAIRLAQLGQGYVEPNPMVGCVLVADGEIIGTGYHRQYGGPHAERNAISDAQTRGNADRIAGCDVFVSLEPCCHHGKTPPCTTALIEARVGRVHIAVQDPFPKVAGGGIAILREALIDVEVGLEAGPARELLAPFLKRVQHQRPWVIAKWAMSLDGRIATASGDSQWISGEESRQDVQRLRGRVDAILVGCKTALQDDPRLTARTSDPPRSALRVVADSRLSIPLTHQLVTTASETPTLLWAGPDADSSRQKTLEQLGVEVQVCTTVDPLTRLDDLLQFLAAEKQVTNLLVEGGAQLLGSLFTLDQLDQCEVYVAPLLIGGEEALSPIGGLGALNLPSAPGFDLENAERFGPDIRLTCKRVRE